jgi:4-carboxymuconolactone decarboxylase
MARIPPRDPDSAPEPIARVIGGAPLALLGIVAHAESAFEPWLRYSNTLLRELELDPLLRELAILQVAHLAVSPYEWTQHVPIAEAFGASPQLITAIESDDREPAEADERQRAVLTFTRAVVLDGEASEGSVVQVRELLGDRGLVELLLVIGNYLGLARLIATVALEPHEPVVRLPGGTDSLGPR